MTTSDTENIEELPKISTHDFFFETGLYLPIDISQFENEDDLNGTVNGYNWIAEMDTTFNISLNGGGHLHMGSDTFYSISSYRHDLSYEFITLTLKCRRDSATELRFNCLINGRLIQKVGQYPSLADIQYAEVGKKYDKVMDKVLLRNLKTAIGLHAHGAGAGSFVYLRRIFESLIQKVFYEAIESGLILLEADFQVLRMDEKVEVIKAYLPEDFSEMRGAYKILSKGVHELTEEECMKYFSILKLSIELILEKRVEQLAKVERAKKTKEALNGAMKDFSEKR